MEYIFESLRNKGDNAGGRLVNFAGGAPTSPGSQFRGLVLRAPPQAHARRHRSLIAGVPLSFFGSYIPLSPVPVSPRSQREERAAACGKFIAPDWCVSFPREGV